MSKYKVFVATPISGFSDDVLYTQYRSNVIKLISELRKTAIVFSEIENFSQLNSYDDPGKSALEDFEKILKCDYFILLHPLKTQTSTLIELGYALAHKKTIIIVSQKKNLPFLAVGLCNVIDNVILIEETAIDDTTIRKVLKLVKGRRDKE